jgi:hypothetical protein
VKERLPIEVPAPALAVSSVGASTADQPRPRSGIREARVLVWQTIREGRRTWTLLAAIGLVVPAALLVLTEGRIPAEGIASWNTLVALTAGVSVFNLENRAGTYRFLAHHGARPGLVWRAKLMTWCFGLAVIWLPLAALVAALPVPWWPREPRPSEDWIWIVLTLPLSFAVGQLCGMAIRRGITAGVVALVATMGLGLAQVGMVRALLMPVWGLVVVPVALLAATWAWSGDWLLDRPAPGRWVRLGVILVGLTAVLFGGYTGGRVWAVPDAGPIAPPLAWVIASPVPPPAERNAADLYREAGRRLGELPSHLVIPHRNHELLDLIRRAAARPDCRFVDPDRLTLSNPVSLPPMHKLAELVHAEARERQGRGDLAGAWDDIVVLFRMARHLGEVATMSQARQALAFEQEALDLAMNWASARRQTPERLHAALAAYRDLPRMIPAADVVRAEGILTERTLELPADDLKGWLLSAVVPQAVALGGDRTVPLWASLWVDLISSPWERARASRINRSYAAWAARSALLEPWQRLPGAMSPAQASPTERPTAEELASTPLAKTLVPNLDAYLAADDRNEVARRALVQVLAIRAWQLRHDGRFPDRLEDLVPEELSSLPADPYAGQPFRYRLEGDIPGWAREISTESPPRQTRVLYSLGPNRRDDFGALSPTGHEMAGDIVFPIPHGRADAGAVKARGRS